jgi:hypothetical protein
MLGMVAHACHPSYMASINRRTEVEASLSINIFKQYLKQKKAGVHGSSGRAPASQVQDPEFNHTTTNKAINIYMRQVDIL